MNFDPVGIDENGEYYMKFNKPFNYTTRIQLLQRWILVHSFAYYELNENIVSDFKYDANAIQLSELIREHPEEFKRSRYYEYFYDYCGEDGMVYTSGFDLLERVKKTDKELYRHIWIDAVWALERKAKRGN